MTRDGPKTVAAVLLAVALGGGGVALGAYQIAKVSQIERGPAVQARATDWNRVSSSRSWVPRVKYEFARDGATRAGTGRVAPEVYDRTRRGEPLTVRVADGNPNWHLPEDAIKDARTTAGLTLFCGVVVLVFALVAVVLMWAARRLKAKRHGASHFPKDPPPAVT